VEASIILGTLGIALLAVLVGYTVPALIQVRKTALAAEEFLRVMTPRVEGATANLDAVLGRIDRIARGMEDGTRGITGALGGVGDFFAGLKPPAQPGGGASSWLAALASLLSGFWQAWSVFTAGAHPQAPPAAGAEGGGNHE
jgi:hypothetical protein